MNPKQAAAPHEFVEPADHFEIVLSNGYRVKIVFDLDNPTESFEHLGRAIVSEIFLHSMEGKGDFKNAFGAVREEITNLVDNLDYSGVRTALKAAIFAHFIKAYNDVQKGLGGEQAAGAAQIRPRQQADLRHKLESVCAR